MPQTIIIIKLIETVVKATLIESIHNGIADFLTDQAKDLGKKEISDRIAKLRSDAKLRTQIQQALERATDRWATDYPDSDLVAAVAENTTFTDLPSVQEAIRTVAQCPFDPVAAETLQGKFDDVLPQRFEPARVERGIAALLEFLREEFAGVSALQQAQQVAAAIETARATAQVAENTAALAHIEQLLKQMLSGPTPTQETLTNYLTWVIDQHRYLDPRGVRQTVRQVQVLLQDVYVSLTAEAEPTLSASDRRLYEHELERLLARDDLQPEEIEDLRENLLARYAQTEETRPKAETIDLSELVGEHDKLVILGDPGAGKTTLLRYLALRHAQALRAGDAETNLAPVLPDHPAPALPGQGSPTRLPLFLRIAEYAEHDNGRTLLDFLPTNIRGEDDSDETLTLLIRERLAQGTCLVLLDGLDEIIEPSQRAEIAAQIDILIRTHERAGNHFVITSRVAGYRSAPLSGDIAHYHVCDMTTDQIRAFLERWCHAVERFQSPDISPEAQSEKARTEIATITQVIEDNPGVRTLAANPLLLRILARIRRTVARLPQRRIELYRLAADTLIRDWQLARGISEAALVKEAEATRLLAELAAWLHQEKPAGIATHGEVRAKLAEVKGRLLGRDPDHPDVLIAVDDFLDRIRQHTGLFVERAPRRYGFMHLTFEEYFAARWLIAQPLQAAHRIRNKLHRPRWQEPILLAIAFYGMEFPDAVDHLIEAAILGQDLGSPSPYEHILHRDLLFAIRCLGDQDVSAGLRRELIADFVHCWLDKDQGGKYEFLRERFGQITQALRGSEAETTLIESLVTALQDKGKSEDVRRSAADALRNITLTAEAVSALLVALQDKSEGVRGRAAYALGKATLTAESVPALLAALTDDSESVRRSATDVLINATLNVEAVSGLLAALQDKSETEGVSSVADALRDITDQLDVIPVLLADLQDENETEGVGHSTFYALRAALRDKDKSEEVRGTAAYALRNATTQPDVVSALLAAFQDKSETEGVRRSVAHTLRNVTTQPDVVYALLTAFQDKSETEGVRRGAVDALINATLTAAAISALLVVLRDKSESEDIRRSAIYALRNATTQPDVVSALLAALQDKSETEGVRGSAAYALGNATLTANTVSALLAALQDTSESKDVHNSAASALGNATLTAKAIPTLLATLQDKSKSKEVRGYAAYALRNATTQRDIVSALVAALTDDSAFVCGNAAYALADLASHPTTTALPDLPDQLIASLDSPGLGKWTRTPQGDYIRPRDQLFQALSAIAPPPQVD